MASHWSNLNHLCIPKAVTMGLWPLEWWHLCNQGKCQVYGYFSHHCDKIPDRNQHRRVILAHRLKVQIIFTGKSQQEECQVAGHIPSKVRKQRAMHIGDEITFSFLFGSDHQPMGCDPHIQGGCVFLSIPNLNNPSQTWGKV